MYFASDSMKERKSVHEIVENLHPLYNHNIFCLKQKKSLISAIMQLLRILTSIETKEVEVLLVLEQEWIKHNVSGASTVWI